MIYFAELQLHKEGETDFHRTVYPFETEEEMNSFKIVMDALFKAVTKRDDEHGTKNTTQTE